MNDVRYTLPRKYFTSTAVFEEEMSCIFYNHWLCVGRLEQVAEPGQFFVHEVGDESIIVLRDSQGELRAFYNLCRHRGTQLCEAGSGRFKNSIQCPYHAWTYSLDGRLIGVPEQRYMNDFNRDDFPLLSVPTAVWEGFIFLNLSTEPEPFAQVFRPVLERWRPWRIADLRVAHSIDYDVAANWKLIVANYNECYHCTVIHPALNRLSSNQSGANQLNQGLFLGGYMTFNEDSNTMSMSGHMCAPPVGDVTGEDLNRVYFFSLFPNLLLSLHPDYVMFHTVWPLSPERSRITCHWLFDPAVSAEPGFDPSDAVNFWDTTNREDWHVCELSQRGIRSRAYVPGPYYEWQEQLLAEFDRQVLLALGHTI